MSTSQPYTMFRNNRIPIVLVAILATFPAVSSAQSGKILEPSEIMALMNASSVTYSVTQTDASTIAQQGMAMMYPRMRQPVMLPQIVKDQRGEHLQTLEVSDDAAAAMKEAEVAFKNKDFAAARERYSKAFEIEPKLYPALEFIGDTYFGARSYDTALVWYNKARTANPLDYQPALYAADALYRMGSLDEAREAMIDVFVLRPRHPNALVMARAMKNIKMSVHDSNFSVHAYAAQTDKGVSVNLPNPPTMPWTAFAFAKAVWIGEPSHRQDLAGDTTLTWSVVHERECLADLLISYQSEREKGGAADADLDRLGSVAEDHLLDAFIIYEIASRMYPDVTLTLSPEARDLVRTYVSKYVLPKV